MIQMAHEVTPIMFLRVPCGLQQGFYICCFWILNKISDVCNHLWLSLKNISWFATELLSLLYDICFLKLSTKKTKLAQNGCLGN